MDIIFYVLFWGQDSGSHACKISALLPVPLTMAALIENIFNFISLTFISVPLFLRINNVLFMEITRNIFVIYTRVIIYLEMNLFRGNSYNDEIKRGLDLTIILSLTANSKIV